MKNSARETPTVSVLLPVFNARRHLRLALESLLAQTFRDFEIVAVDDGSTDDSRAILEGYARSDPRIRVLSRANTGIVGALNDAVAAARGEFLARMDADDWCAPRRLEKQIAFLQADTGCLCVGSAVIFMDAESDPLKLVPRETAHEAIEAALLAGDGGALIHPAVTMRAAAVKRAGAYRPETQYLEDIDLFLRLARLGRLANLPDPFLCYRVHAGSINFRKNEGRFRLLQRILAEAHAARGFPFAGARKPAPTAAPGMLADLHLEWAATALHFGKRRVAVRHALAACRAGPLAIASWRALRYALCAPMRGPRPDVPLPTKLDR